MSKLTPKKRAEFFALLADGNTVKAAAAAVGVTRQAVYALRKSDPDFWLEWQDSEEEGTEALEQEAKRRAVDGTVKPVFHQGRLVTDAAGNPMGIREYSDTLLIFLLKARKPDTYRDNVKHEVSGPGGGPIPTEAFEYNAALAAFAGRPVGDSQPPG